LKVGKSDVLIGSYWASIRDFPFGPSLQNHTSLSIDRLTLHPDGELRAKIRLDFERPFTDIDQTTIEKRFGRSWTEEEAVLPPHPIPMSIGRKITYQAGNDKSGRTVSFVFQRDGTLGTMFVEVNRPKQ
jgi:hypothetical protein